MGVVFYIFLKSLRINSIYNSLIIKKAKLLLVLGDVWPEENAVVQLFKKSRLKTVTLQHGLFIDNPEEKKIDTLNYLYVPSDFELCWGGYTLNMMKKYNSNLLTYVCGNPTISKTKKLFFNEQCLGLVFDTVSLKNYNAAMLNIVVRFAKLNNKRVKIRIHPTDVPSNYNIDETFCSFEKDLDDCFVIIGHTSTMLVTYMVKGNRVIKYDSDVKSVVFDSRIVFRSFDEFNVCLNTCVKFDYNLESKKYIAFSGDESKEKYKNIIESIMSNHEIRY